MPFPGISAIKLQQNRFRKPPRIFQNLHNGQLSEKACDWIGKGSSQRAACPSYPQDVMVVGGGDTALEEALILSHHASKVIVVRRRDALRAGKIMQNRAIENVGRRSYRLEALSARLF